MLKAISFIKTLKNQYKVAVMTEAILNVIKRLKYRIKLAFKIFINTKLRYYMHEDIN